VVARSLERSSGRIPIQAERSDSNTDSNLHDSLRTTTNVRGENPKTSAIHGLLGTPVTERLRSRKPLPMTSDLTPTLTPTGAIYLNLRWTAAD
jgi:hypothetical protein